MSAFFFILGTLALAHQPQLTLFSSFQLDRFLTVLPFWISYIIGVFMAMSPSTLRNQLMAVSFWGPWALFSILLIVSERVRFPSLATFMPLFVWILLVPPRLYTITKRLNRSPLFRRNDYQQQVNCRSASPSTEVSVSVPSSMTSLSSESSISSREQEGPSSSSSTVEGFYAYS